MTRALDARLSAIVETATSQLENDVLPFWMRHAFEPFRGEAGFCFNLGRRGDLLDSDRAVWPHARFVWLLSTLAIERSSSPQRGAWIDAEDGRCFFLTDREGRALRKRRYVFTELFVCMALARFAALSDDEAAYRAEAVRLWDLVDELLRGGALPSKWTDARPTRGIGVPMIRLGVSQVLRAAAWSTTPGVGDLDQAADDCCREIEAFLRADLGCVLEVMSVDGEALDSFDGRCLKPGHAIEAAAFLYQEAQLRGVASARAASLRESARTMLELSLAHGWDERYGGLLYFVDRDGREATEYWHDMKFWWPHCEAMLACLLAFEAHEEPRWLDRYDEIRSWTIEHFRDADFGECFGYLHRDGSVSSEIKGNVWKGPFHLPRALHECARVAARVRAAL